MASDVGQSAPNKRRGIQVVQQNNGKSRKNGNGKLSEKEFVLRAIPNLRNGKSKGIHTVYSGFNQAFRTYFGAKADPVKVTTQLGKDGVIFIRPCKGGVMIYLPEDTPPPTLEEKGGKALAAILG